MSKATVMVALGDMASVESLMTLACQLGQVMDADLLALNVVEIPLLTPLEASDEIIDHPGKELLAHAVAVAKTFSRSLSTELIRAREVGEAIVAEAKERGVALLIIGHHKPRAHSLGECCCEGRFNMLPTMRPVA